MLEEFGGVPRPGDRRNILVRLDTRQHEALKGWCQSHDFTMATVVRGLLGRFLEQQSLEQTGAELPGDEPGAPPA
jgi:hypothetical protein